MLNYLGNVPVIFFSPRQMTLFPREDFMPSTIPNRSTGSVFTKRLSAETQWCSQESGPVRKCEGTGATRFPFCGSSLRGGQPGYGFADCRFGDNRQYCRCPWLGTPPRPIRCATLGPIKIIQRSQKDSRMSSGSSQLPADIATSTQPIAVAATGSGSSMA